MIFDNRYKIDPYSSIFCKSNKMEEIANLSQEARDILRYHITLDKNHEYTSGFQHGFLMGILTGVLCGIGVYATMIRNK